VVLFIATVWLRKISTLPKLYIAEAHHTATFNSKVTFRFRTTNFWLSEDQWSSGF